MQHITYHGTGETPLFASILGFGHPLIILHGGGPDRYSILPFAQMLSNVYKVIFPDIRGYGESVCFDTSVHTWEQYAADTISLMEACQCSKAAICGMGLGASIAERVAYTYPDRISALILISPENLDEDGMGSSPTEVRMLEECAETAKTKGLAEAWRPFIKSLAPVTVSMVYEAIPRMNPDSFAAAMAIGYSRRLEARGLLSRIHCLTLIIPGNDARHTFDIAAEYQRLIPNCTIGKSIDWKSITTVEELAKHTVSQMEGFLASNSPKKTNREP